jgi:hypothetical protein
MVILEMRGIESFIKMENNTINYGEEFRNLMAGIYTPEELNKIRDAKLSISGVGGSAGSYLIDILVRKGFEDFVLSEPDDYEIRNLSRQLFANTSTLGKSKLEVTMGYVTQINPNVKCKAIRIVDLDSVEEFVKDSTVVSHQAEGFSSWVLTQYMCSKYNTPFVNVARKGNLRTTIATRMFDYRTLGDVFNIRSIDFDSFGIPEGLVKEVIEMFDENRLDKGIFDEADRIHNSYKKKKRFLDLGEMYPEVGSITDKFPEDYFKRYSDPEICFIAGALASRAITDLVVGRTTKVFELDIFSRK